MRITLPLALVIFAAWLLLTIGLGWLTNGGRNVPLSEIVERGIGMNWLAALILLLFVILACERQGLGLDAPRPFNTLTLLWLPLLYLALLATLLSAERLPPAVTVAYIAINTGMVAVSEELMTRGILLKGLLSRLSIWLAILLSSLAFGLMHVLNVIITGQWTEAVVQALSAFMIGVGYIAIRIRTRSLYPMMVIHAFWDFLLFMIAASPASSEMREAQSPNTFSPLLMALPMFCYGLFLLRRVSTGFSDISNQPKFERKSS